jgi:CRP-like cAMP-binding protein
LRIDAFVTTASPRFENRLLALMDGDELRELRPDLERVYLKQGTVLIEPNEPIRFVHFPIDALASLVTVFEDGTTVEAGSAGREGMTGVPVILNAKMTPMQTLIQVAGEVYRLPAARLKEAFDRHGPLYVALTRYVHTLFVVASQSAACNRRHTVEARLCRWLLMSSDGIGSDEINITQEYLAAMLGVRRPGVTEAAVKLQGEGLIRYVRGFVEIVDRPRLEAAACECYHMVRDEYERLLGPM